MRKLLCSLAILSLFLITPSAIHAKDDSLFNSIEKGVIFSDSGLMTVLYSAHKDVLAETNPLDIRMLVTSICPANWSSDLGSLQEILKELIATAPNKERWHKILRVTLVFRADLPRCSALWVAYTEK